MVKDTLREIKKRKLQFFAILLITALGVGFFIGIRVTGFDMRKTADLYMDEADVLDIQIMNSLGIDDAMVEEIDTIVQEQANKVYWSTVYANSSASGFDGVINLYDINAATLKDITLTEGRLPSAPNEAFVDSLLISAYKLKIGDTISIKANDVFEASELTIVGAGNSALYLNKSRGYTNMGSGEVQAYVYAQDLTLKNDVIPTIRYSLSEDKDVDDVLVKLNKHKDELTQARFDRLIQPEIDKLKDAKAEIAANKVTFNQEMIKQENQLKAAENSLAVAHTKLSDGLTALTLDIPTSGTLDERLAMVEASYTTIKTMLETSIKDLKARIAEVQLPELKVELEKELAIREGELNETSVKYSSGIASLRAGINEYNQGVKDLEAGKAALASAKVSFAEEISKAEAEVAAAYKKIENADLGSLYIYERKDAIIGYTDFYNDSERIEAIGNIFPLIFFGVSILITLSTMSQMVDESRSQLGVYKALGYSSFRASLKYVSFAFIGWLVGVLIGIFMGFYLLPNIIYNAYRIMYETPELESAIVLSYLWLPLVVSFVASVGVAYFKAMRVSKEQAANLLRPPLPKSGQRIFLERIPLVWNHLSFLYKVSLRNLFRNKVRFFMTVIGIAGCTGLLITGFGISHSINSIIDIQFEEIFIYDGMISYTNNEDLDASLYDTYIDIYSENVQIEDTPVTMFVSDDLLELNNYFKMNDINSDDFKFKEDEVIISEKLAEVHNLDINDKMSVKINKLNYEFTVSKIIKNHAGHYLIMDKDIYTTTTNDTYSQNVRFINGANLDNDTKTLIMEDDNVLNVTLLGAMETTFKEQMGNFDIIIIVVIGAAILLEVIVLANLISMNISERKKELATLKVLGFYPRELSTYILRENIIMTFISLIVGVGFGYFLHLFVTKTAEIDMVMFNRNLNLSSIIYSMIFTVIVSLVINLIMSRRADKVNMNEALKTFDA